MKSIFLLITIALLFGGHKRIQLHPPEFFPRTHFAGIHSFYAVAEPLLYCPDVFYQPVHPGRFVPSEELDWIARILWDSQ